MLNGQKVIGIVPFAPLFGKQESRYDDKYFFTDTYGVRVQEAGMIPLGVLPVMERIRSNVLELCDAFVMQGGQAISPFHMEVIDHAIRTGKKLLGICLGCQALQCYFQTRKEAEERGFTGSIGDLYAQLKHEEKYIFLKELDGHYPSPVLPREGAERTKHPVILEEDSNLAKILGKTRIMGASFHHFCIGYPAPGLTVTGRAEDGTIEVVESGEKIIGTQFHPDVDDELHEIFDWLGK